MKSLNRREKLLIVSGIALLTLFCMYQFVISDARDRSKLLERIIPEKEQELEEILQLKKEYDALKRRGSQKTKIMGEGKGAVTLSYLESLAEKSGLKKNIRHMKPLGKSKGEGYVENSMEIKLSRIPVEHLVRFLYDIENSKRSVKITELDILINKKDFSTLDAKIQIVSFEST